MADHRTRMSDLVAGLATAPIDPDLTVTSALLILKCESPDGTQVWCARHGGTDITDAELRSALLDLAGPEPTDPDEAD